MGLKLSTLRKMVDGYFLIVPVIGMLGIIVSIILLSKRLYMQSAFWNMVLNIITIILFLTAYIVYILSLFDHDLESILNKKSLSFFLIACAYYLYSLILAVLIVFYNPMSLSILMLSLAMLFLNPYLSKHFMMRKYLIIGGLSLFGLICIAQIYSFLGKNLEELTLDYKEYILVTIFYLKIMFIIFFYTHIKNRMQKIDDVTPTDSQDENINLSKEKMALLKGVLSGQEFNVGTLILQKFVYEQIGEILNISKSTVQTYSKRIFEKFGVKNRKEFINFFYGDNQK